jgi:RND family efflux transporter MFP subunit
MRRADARAWLGLAALAWLAAAGACRRTPAESEELPTGPKRVRCAPVESRELQDSIELHGNVAPLPDRDAQVAAQVPGRISHVLVREGDRVTRGQPLARIDEAALTDQAKQAAAQLAKARAESNLASVSRARIQRVFEHGIAARQELDDAEGRLATSRASESEATASNEIANRQLDRATVRSPLDGVVLRLFRKSGELVDGTPALPIVEVGDPSRLEIVASATAADLVQLRAGAAATVALPALPALRLVGTVSAVSPAVDRATGLGVVRVALDLTAGAAPPIGVTGAVAIRTGPRRPGWVVPTTALRNPAGDDAEVVLCGADGRAHVVHVRPGVATAGRVEIRATGDAGVPLAAAGTSVAVEPVLGLADGDALERRP